MSKEYNSIISVKNLHKDFRIARRGRGLKGAIRYLFSRKYTIKRAVNDISFEIAPGDMVGYIGRNGAGKSTTIKMMTGILVPTSGEIVVDGIVPYKKRTLNGGKIGVVFGQRTQLRWDIPVIESYRLLKEIYNIPIKVYKENIEYFSYLLKLNNLLSIPARKLSLGQRMQCDLVASFLHNPMIVYLDEPTIGMDIIGKENIRDFIKSINKERGTTVILTTHDLTDFEDICKRAIIIDSGKKIYDGGFEKLDEQFGGYRILKFELKDTALSIEKFNSLPDGMEIISLENNYFKTRINKNIISAPEGIRFIIDKVNCLDVSIEDTSIATTIKAIYRNGLKT